MVENKENAIAPAFEDDSIRPRILTIRGVQVMLDRDLAELYGVQTKALNQTVKRNIERFPERFMFQLSKEDIYSLRSQIAPSNTQSDTIAFPHEAYGSSLRSQIVTLNDLVCQTQQ